MLKMPERPTRRLVGSIHAHPYLWLLGAVLVTAVMLNFGRTIQLRSNIKDLLPESAPSVKAMEVLDKRLGSADLLVVTLMTNDFDAVKAALPGIADAVRALPDVRKVDWRLDVAMIDKNALIVFPTLAELEDYYKELTDAIRKAVKKSLKLFDDDEPAAKAAIPGVEDGATLAWAEIEFDDGLSNLSRTFRSKRGDYREFFYNREYTTIGFQVYPTTGSGNLSFCRKILKEVGDIVDAEVTQRLGAIGPDGVVKRVDLGGGYRSALQQSNQIKDDMASSAGISFILLALVVILFFRSIRAVFCVLVPLIFGISWTVGLVALTVGYLNLITAFIFAVLLGLGIDFGIHFYGRYREERAAGVDPLEAMTRTHLHCGEASLLAGTTTTGAFLALTLADFRGFSQFGGVAAAGVILCFLAVLIVFPTIAFIFERWVELKLMGYSVDRGADGDIVRKRFPLGAKTVIVAVLVGLTGFGAFAKTLQFEMDFRNLGEKESADHEYEEIQRGTSQSTSPAVIFTTSATEARNIYDQLEERTSAVEHHPRIKSYQALFALVPDHQAEKIEWVHKICRKLKRKVKLFEGDPRDGADELLSHCNPAAFEVAELPDWVKAKFSDKDGKLGEFIFVSPRGSTSDGETAMAFREEMLTLKGLDGQPPVVSGKPMVWAEVLIAMREDGILTTTAALITVFLLVLLFERRLRSVAVVLLPLFIGLGLTAGAMAVFEIKLNFFNMLAFPTIIGMGVDNGVHMFHRYKELGPNSGMYILKTTGMSASLATVTTVIGFASLMTANHYGLNSLGLLTVIGMLSTLAATLVVLPAAMRWSNSSHADA